MTVFIYNCPIKCQKIVKPQFFSPTNSQNKYSLYNDIKKRLKILSIEKLLLRIFWFDNNFKCVLLPQKQGWGPSCEQLFNKSLFPSGSSMGLHHECSGPLHLPVSGRHWWEAGEEDQQQLGSGRALRSRLRCRLHRCSTQPKLLLFRLFRTSCREVYSLFVFSVCFLQSLLLWDHAFHVE